MAKINTKIRYLCQDLEGGVHSSIDEPEIDKECDGWINCSIYFIQRGKKNTNWRDTLIDLDVDDYEFENGILRRIENDTTKN